ncbi:hypothetical protein [Actinomyces radicidentis]|uniref:hypothetical protein n=1 Tax=Actinomyces radicidentis TaxID=111015 RepID=UPI0026DEC8BB|nr:hypothetical protein [Actinomyces radicidentis]
MSEQQAPAPAPSRPVPGPAAGGARPVPAPPRAQAAAERAAHPPDHTARLDGLDELPIEERAAVLVGVHDGLASFLRDAED